MAFPFLKNPLRAIVGPLRSLVDIAGNLREPLGAAIAGIGRALGRLGAEVEASAIRNRLEREAESQRQARGALGKAAGAIPDEASIPEATTKLRRRFSYTVRVTHIDPATGQRVTRHITVSSDSLLSETEAREHARGIAGGPYGIKDSFITEIEVTGVKKAGAAGTL